MKSPYFVIQSERPSDVPNIETLLDEALGVARYERGVYRLRLPRRQDLEASLIMRAHNEIVASIRFWSIEGPMRARLLGPLAVCCQFRRMGIGQTLVEVGLSILCQADFDMIVVVGDPRFYGRFGFRKAPDQASLIPGPVKMNRILSLELRDPRSADRRARFQQVRVRLNPAARVSEPRATSNMPAAREPSQAS